MKIFVSKINESWIVDRQRREWYKYNQDISTRFLFNSDIVWIISPWTWKNISIKNYKDKKIVCSIHHIDFDKFINDEKKEFYERDEIVDTYHVFSKSTEKQLKEVTDKKIVRVPYWVNQNIWYEIKEKNNLRLKFGFQHNDFLVGSFQRDTEGKDLTSPKLSKGPDIFLKKIIEINKSQKNLKVVLSGKRRNYLIRELEKSRIRYSYFEMTDLKTLNELYNVLDLYMVTSRVEGGPQAILECAISRTPIVSTDVGIASEILHKNSIIDLEYNTGSPNVDYAFKNAVKYLLPEGMNKFRNFFEIIYES